MMLKIVSNKSSIDTAGAATAARGAKTGLGGVELAPAVQLSLHGVRRSVSDLRLQLHQMKQLQLQNQEMLRAMVKKAELEINGKMIETVKRLEDPVQRQRNLVEQERQKYLNEEEKIVKKLCELEAFVEDLKRDSTATGKAVTLKDVEDGAFLLRQVGEAVATLKGEFPTLQNKMRAILRIEVEAVRFLKEEPHKLDSLLKRVRSMTDILTVLRRHVTDGLLRGVDPSQALQYSTMEKATTTEALKNQEELKHAQGHTQPNLTAIATESQVSSVKSEVVPFSSMTVHHVQSSPVVIHQSQHSSALVNHSQGSPCTGSPGEGPPASSHSVASPVEPAAGTQATPAPHVSVNGATMQSLFIEEIHSASTRNRAVSIEKAEKKWEEKRQNLDHYNGKEFEKLLEEAQANIMKSIPNLEMPPQPVTVTKGDTMEKLEVSEDLHDAEEGNDKLTKSPPPPPPRRSYLPGSALTTTRSGDVVYAVRKDAAAVKECSEDTGQTAQSKAPKEDQASSRSPGHAAASAAKDEDEEEGDKIMAELQAFQKCSFMDVNSNSHAEQSRNDTHAKDIRPGTLMHHKEKKGSSAASQTSRMPVPMASKSRQGSTEKASKQHKLQDPRQYRQANGSAKKAGGDYKATSPTLPASKIPAFSPTSGKSGSAPTASGDSSNPLPAPAKASVPSSNLLGPQTGRASYTPSLIPTVANGSSKFASPALPGKGHPPSFSLQTQNGRPLPSSSSSSPSSACPPALSPPGKSIRTIHTPSFTSYKAHNGNAGKCTPSAAREPA